MKPTLFEIRSEEAFYHSTHYQQFTIQSKNSWLGYPVKKLVDLGLSISNSSKSSHFLDLGCGVGRNSIPIVQVNPSTNLQIDCVDILSTAIESFSDYTKKNDTSRFFNFFTSDVFDFDLQPETYDYIFSVSTLEHLANKKQFISVLTGIKEATTDNGFIYLIINSEVSEFIIKEQKQISPYLELNLPTAEILAILTDLFDNWTILETEIKHLTYEIERRIGISEMKTNAVTFIAQKTIKADLYD